MKNIFKTALPAAAGMLAVLMLSGCGVITDGITMVEDKTDLKSFDTLDINVRSIDVMLTLGDSFQVSYKTEKGSEPVISEKGGKLSIEQPDRTRPIFPIRITPEKEFYQITVPKDYDKEISLTAQASSADIMLDRVKVSGEASARSGDVQLNDIEGGRLKVETKSGDIECDKVKTGQAAFSATSGDIEILRLFTDDFQGTTTSGDIEINNSDIKNAECAATSGDIEIELLGNEEDYSFKLDTTSGSIKLNGRKLEEKYEKDGGAFSINASTTSGDIEISVK